MVYLLDCGGPNSRIGRIGVIKVSSYLAIWHHIIFSLTVPPFLDWRFLEEDGDDTRDEDVQDGETQVARPKRGQASV